MTPEAKAQELLEKYYVIPGLDAYNAKQCARICVEEIIKHNPANFGYGKRYWAEVLTHLK